MNSNHIKTIGLSTASIGLAYALTTFSITNQQPNEQMQNHSRTKNQQEMTARMKHLENNVADLVRTIAMLTDRINTLTNNNPNSSRLPSSYLNESTEQQLNEEFISEQTMDDSTAQKELLADDAPFWQEQADQQRTQNLETEILEIFQAQGIDNASLGVVDCRSSGCLLEISSSGAGSIEFDPSSSILAMSNLPESFFISPPVTVGDEKVSKIFLEF